MMAASNQDFRNVNPYINSAFCSSCGVCEMYACPQSLAPRTLLADMKGGLRKAGIRPPQGVQPKPVQESREYRKVPEERLMARLGLTRCIQGKSSLKPAYWCTGTGNRKCRRYGNRRSDDRTACTGIKCRNPCNDQRKSYRSNRPPCCNCKKLERTCTK